MPPASRETSDDGTDHPPLAPVVTDTQLRSQLPDTTAPHFRLTSLDAPLGGHVTTTEIGEAAAGAGGTARAKPKTRARQARPVHCSTLRRSAGMGRPSHTLR